MWASGRWKGWVSATCWVNLVSSGLPLWGILPICKERVLLSMPSPRPQARKAECSPLWGSPLHTRPVDLSTSKLPHLEIKAVISHHKAKQQKKSAKKQVAEIKLPHGSRALGQAEVLPSLTTVASRHRCNTTAIAGSQRSQTVPLGTAGLALPEGGDLGFLGKEGEPMATDFPK